MAFQAPGHMCCGAGMEGALPVPHNSQLVEGDTIVVPPAIPELSSSSTRILLLLKARHGASGRPGGCWAALPHANGQRQRGRTPGGDRSS